MTKEHTMKWYNFIGLFIILSPLLLAFGMLYYDAGLFVASACFALVGVLYLIIILGFKLLWSGR